jgi:hypothetical protein
MAQIDVVHACRVIIACLELILPAYVWHAVFMSGSWFSCVAIAIDQVPVDDDSMNMLKSLNFGAHCFLSCSQF